MYDCPINEYRDIDFGYSESQECCSSFCNKYIYSGCVFIWASASTFFGLFAFLLSYYVYYAIEHDDPFILPLIVGLVTLLSIIVLTIGICFRHNCCLLRRQHIYDHV